MAFMGSRPGKVTRYRRYSWLNIGTMLFLAIFIYMLISVIMYLTAEHTTSYEVTAGSISGNYRYTALALKNETIVPAGYSGYVTYYAREGARAGSGMTVCSIDENGTTEKVETVQATNLTDSDLTHMRSEMSSFTLNFQNSSFQDVYNFKANVESYLLTTLDVQTTTGLVNPMNSPDSGFVVYSKDGMEGLADSDINESLFNRNNYESVNLRLDNVVSTGDPVYKLITGEDWRLYFPITQDLATELQDRTSIRFRFLKDDTTFSASFSVLASADGTYYGKISLSNSLVRYVSDRYLEIELLMDRKTGLKIPGSAIAEKHFYRIPKDYVITNNDTDGEITMLRERFGKDGTSNVEYITATVYDKAENDYLVDTSLFRTGDYVQMAETTKKHEITDDDLTTIQGVYNINKGYAIFREVTVIDQNEEFCVVEPNNPYGLAAHDFIVLDASSVSGDEIV